MPTTIAPIVRDIGMVASQDPVAIDQASADLVNQETAVPGSWSDPEYRCRRRTNSGAIYPEIDWPTSLNMREKIGLGFARVHTGKRFNALCPVLSRGDIDL